MLDVWIIKKIKKDEQRRKEQSQPSISIEPPPFAPRAPPPSRPQRGVVIIQLC